MLRSRLYSDVAWASWRPRSTVTRPFVQQLVQSSNKGNIQVSHHRPFLRAMHLCPADSPHKGPVMWKAYRDVIISNFMAVMFQRTTVFALYGPLWVIFWCSRVQLYEVLMFAPKQLTKYVFTNLWMNMHYNSNGVDVIVRHKIYSHKFCLVVFYCGETLVELTNFEGINFLFLGETIGKEPWIYK